MYKCINCNNVRDFKETYHVDTIVVIEDWENISSYDEQSDLIMIQCLNCKNNTEDKSIIWKDWEEIIIN